MTKKKRAKPEFVICTQGTQGILYMQEDGAFTPNLFNAKSYKNMPHVPDQKYEIRLRSSTKLCTL
jgi:hypothetical protein